MTVPTSATTDPLANLPIDRRAVSELLLATGIALDGPSAAAIVLGGADILLAMELAQTLPPDGDYLGAIQCLHTFAETPVIPQVREAQTKLFRLFGSECEEEIMASPMYGARLDQLRQTLTAPAA